MIADCFHEFLDYHVCIYPNHKEVPVHFVGSIAYQFQAILKEVLIQKNIQCGHILKAPIYNLARHLFKSVSL